MGRRRAVCVKKYSSEPVARIREQINPTYVSSSPTQEDWYWGRLATGDEEDYYWRRLSDNWYQKDVIPSTYLELHNQCYEAYNANPLAFAIIEITTSFVMGKGVTVTAAEADVQRILMDFWNEPQLMKPGEREQTISHHLLLMVRLLQLRQRYAEANPSAGEQALLEALLHGMDEE